MSKHVLIDVRSEPEWHSGHIKGAVLWPIEKFTDNQLPAIDKSDEIYLYCRTGNRSAIVAKKLYESGFAYVTNLGSIQSASMFGPIVKDP